MIRIFSSLGRDLGIDIGTVNTHVHVQGRGAYCPNRHWWLPIRNRKVS